MIVRKKNQTLGGGRGGGIAPVSTFVEVVISGSIQDVAISGLSSGWLRLSEESMTRVRELVTLASSIAASSGSLPGVAV